MCKKTQIIFEFELQKSTNLQLIVTLYWDVLSKNELVVDAEKILLLQNTNPNFLGITCVKFFWDRTLDPFFHER